MELKKIKTGSAFLGLFFCGLAMSAQTELKKEIVQPAQNNYKQAPDTLVTIKNPQPSPGVTETMPTPTQQGFDMQVINGQTIYRKTVGNVTIEYKPQ